MIRQPTRIAVIDIGSNTVRLQVSDVRDKSYRVIEEYKEIVRIGDEVFGHGSITPAAEERLMTALREIRGIIDRCDVATVRAVATAAFRAADNHDEVMQRVTHVLGHPVDIITGEDEARLTYLAASANFQLSKYRALVMDIGGGSTEFSVVDNGHLSRIHSLPLGCNLITRTHLPSDPPTPDEISDLKAMLKKTIRKLKLKKMDLCICTGGSMSAIATIAELAEKNPGTGNSQVRYMERTFLKQFINQIKWMPVADRVLIDGMEPRRADIILAAAIQTDIILDIIGCDGFAALSGGLRQGLAIDTINRMGGTLPFQEEPADGVRLSRIVEIGNKFAFEEEHARRVARIALDIFSGLETPLKLNRDDRRILEAAAMLHDIGSYISYAKHHKHSAYLIENSDLVGYAPDEVARIADIARHHRKRTPKLTYKDGRRIVKDSKYRTAVLVGILRIADALDRSHKGRIASITVAVTPEDIDMTPETTSEDIDMERKGFEYKKAFLEHLSGRRVVLS